jgi:hypothetical protein
MSSGTELSAVIFGQHVHLILILFDFFFWGCLQDKFYSNNPLTEELRENIRREIPIFLQRLKRYTVLTLPDRPE